MIESTKRNFKVHREKESEEPELTSQDITSTCLKGWLLRVQLWLQPVLVQDSSVAHNSHASAAIHGGNKMATDFSQKTHWLDSINGISPKKKSAPKKLMAMVILRTQNITESSLICDDMSLADAKAGSWELWPPISVSAIWDTLTFYNSHLLTTSRIDQGHLPRSFGWNLLEKKTTHWPPKLRFGYRPHWHSMWFHMQFYLYTAYFYKLRICSWIL